MTDRLWAPLNSDSWSTRRPASFDSASGNWSTQSGIWSNSPPATAPNFPLSRNGYKNSPQTSPGFQDSNPFESPNLMLYELNLRRHSHPETYNPGPHDPPTFLPKDEVSVAQEAIRDYFQTDHHERVKVTLKFLEEHFFDEEKFLTENYLLPKFPVENSLRNYQLVLIGFKAGRIDVFYLPSKNPELQNLKVGDLVIVEADRGRDLGQVFKLNISIDEARLMKLLQFQEQQAALNEGDSDLSIKHVNSNSGVPPTLHFPKSILSLARHNEIIQILNKKQDEEKACRLCLAKIANTTNMLNNGGSSSSMSSVDLIQMKLIDAEYQYDRKKLIFYYSTSKRIDFRDLVRELFRIYKTRIWMCAVTGIPYISNHQQYPARDSQSHHLGNQKQNYQPVGNHSNQGLPQPSHYGQHSPTLPVRHTSFSLDRRMSYQPIQPLNLQQSITYSDTLMLPPNFAPPYNEDVYVPRRFPGGTDENTNTNDERSESFVLKSLVDSINH